MNDIIDLVPVADPLTERHCEKCTYTKAQVRDMYRKPEGLASTERGQFRRAHVANSGRNGNLNPLRHGVYAKSAAFLRSLEPEIRKRAREVMSAASWLQPSDLGTVRSYARISLLLDQSWVVLQRVKPYRIDKDDVSGRKLLGDFARLASEERALAAQLGLTPASRAALAGNVAVAQNFDIASELARVRLARQQGIGYVEGQIQ